MPQRFHPATNFVVRLGIVLGPLTLAACGGVAVLLYRSPYLSREMIPWSQPVPFSHQHHVGGLGIDCRYCHTTVETGAFAGLPPTATCLTCHSQIWTNAAMLASVRESGRTGHPLAWTRVHDLPDFVYFDHSIHVRKGIGCSTCHGRIDQMPLTWQVESLQMRWCIDCHESPAKFIRPESDIFAMEWSPPAGSSGVKSGSATRDETRSRQLLNCSTCHR